MVGAHPINLPVYPIGYGVITPPGSCNQERGELKPHLESD